MKAKWLVAVVAASFLAPLSALAVDQVRTIEIAVTSNGFEPARVKVMKGEPLKLVVTRKTDETCATQIVIPDENIKADLPLNKPVTLTFTPKRAGELSYACGMNMITGVLVVASSDAPENPGKSRAQANGDVQGSRGMGGMHGMGEMKNHDGGAMQGKGCGCMHRGTASDGS
jgi:plastocyanin